VFVRRIREKARFIIGRNDKVVIETEWDDISALSVSDEYRCIGDRGEVKRAMVITDYGRFERMFRVFNWNRNYEGSRSYAFTISEVGGCELYVWERVSPASRRVDGDYGGWESR